MFCHDAIWIDFAIETGLELGGQLNHRMQALNACYLLAWEDVHVSPDPKHMPSPRFRNPEFRLLFATLVIHYWKHAGFMSGDGTLANVVDVDGHGGETMFNELTRCDSAVLGFPPFQHESPLSDSRDR
jgi:hypothetical protein